MKTLELLQSFSGQALYELAIRDSGPASRTQILQWTFHLSLGSDPPFSSAHWARLLVVWVPLRCRPVFTTVSAWSEFCGTNCFGGISTWGASWWAGSSRQTGRISTEDRLMHPGQDSSVESLTVQLAGLELTISARRLEPGETPQPAAEVGVAPTPEVTSDPYNISTELEDSVIAVREAAGLAAIALPFLTFLEGRLRGAHAVWTPRARLARAFRAGVIARRHLNGEFQTGTSPAIPFRNSLYITLREAGNDITGFWTTSYSTYTRRVGHYNPTNGSFHPDSVSHAFPSSAEGEAYLVGARRRWPPVAA